MAAGGCGCRGRRRFVFNTAPPAAAVSADIALRFAERMLQHRHRMMHCVIPVVSIIGNEAVVDLVVRTNLPTFP